MSMRSGDIRDQSRKLSEKAPNFGRFFALPNFRGPAFQVIPILSPPPLGTSPGKIFVKIHPLA